MANPAFFYTNSAHRDGSAAGGAPTVLSTRVRRGSVRSSPGSRTACSSPRRSAPTPYLYSSIRDQGGHEDCAAPDRTVNSSFSLSRDGCRRSRSCAPTPKSMSEVYVVSARTDSAGEEDHRHERADRDVDDQHARRRLVEEPGRRDDRRRAAQAGRLRSRQKYPLLVVIHGGPTGVSRADAVHQHDLSDRRLGAARRRSCSSRTIAAAPATARSSAR